MCRTGFPADFSRLALPAHARSSSAVVPPHLVPPSLPPLSPSLRAARPAFSCTSYLLLSVWLFAALVPFTDFVANRQANVSATLDGIALPQSVIQAVQAQSGVTGTYHEISYLRLATVFPRWIAFLFGALSAVLSYTTATERSPDSARYPLVAGGRAGSIRDVDDKPKEAEQVGIRQV
ncbi:predicted protein [Sparassis crispa]|uniref:Uncharacterized protein n=1 Tax=Sparassis crispa TaxID=139825 RepID=A0A401GYS2_9APHY|nr:predicted protein [Sparassis crispa]GBE87313.1 predicted protein [Sparassis crispa]